MRVFGSIGRATLRIFPHLLGERLHELVERGTQVVGQLLDFLVARTAFQRLLQGFLRSAQGGFRVGDIAVLDEHGHLPQPADDVAQAHRRTWRAQAANRSSADRDKPGFGVNFSGAMVSASSASSTRGFASASSARSRRCSIKARASGLPKGRSGNCMSNGSERPSLPPSSAPAASGRRRRRPRDVRRDPQGLADAVAGACLRQRERHVGRAIERTRGVEVGSVSRACDRKRRALRRRRNRLRPCNSIAAIRAVAAPDPW